MSLRRAPLLAVLFALLANLVPSAAPAQSPPDATRLYSDMRWRSIGPFRGGRTDAVAGIPSQPGVFYMAPTNGGVWKTTDYGRTWNPIFDGQDTGSIGALAVAPSDANVIYVGSGEGLRRPDLSVGDGIYRSDDAGKTWQHLGLRDGEQINDLAVDPRDPHRVFAAVVGHPYGPNPERGLYRSTDSGATWQKILGPDDGDTGAEMVKFDPKNPNVMYAALWASRNGPWRLTQVYELYQKGGLYKSTDGGATWTQLKSGLPAGVGRIGLSITQSDTNRLYAVVEKERGCAIYRSDNAGATWQQTNAEPRVCGRTEDFAGIAADPSDANVVYAANTQTYKSTDGGKTFVGFKGAPGGDDYHTIYIDPTNHNIMLLGVDQGATLSVNGGATWSSWYNQPTAQFYHVITDDRFPYRVFGGQQESGSAEVSSRSDDGSVWIKYWHPVGTEEYGYVAPDPLHPNIIYGGKATRYDEVTHQTQDVSPTYDRRAVRFNRTAPLIFNRIDKHVLYLGANVIFATRNGGHSWSVISPDLTRTNPGTPPGMGAFASTDPQNGQHRGVVYSLSPSYIDKNLIWAGTDDGLMWVTHDSGKHWKNVTPAGLGPWSKVSQIDASHFDRNTAYIAVTRLRLNDLHPYIYRTHDGGASWQLVTGGLPEMPTDTVREDPVRKGLLYAGTERTVYVSFDDGAHWQSLQLNLPSTSIRDLVVHGDDLVVGTHGRSFWILDDVTPLRQYDSHIASAPAYLFAPQQALRVRRDTWTDTPLPPEEPAGQNPPDGAVIDYYLGSDATGPLTIRIYDAAGTLVRSYASTDQPQTIDPEITVPTYWVRPTAIPSAQAGMHRFVWDLHYTDPDAFSHDYPISAIVHDTPRGPQGVIALPGRYTVRMTVGGHTYTRPLVVRMDPRVTLSQTGLHEQFALASRIVTLMNRTYAAASAAHGNDAQARRLSGINAQLGQLLDVVEGADALPTEQAKAAVSSLAAQVTVGH